MCSLLRKCSAYNKKLRASELLFLAIYIALARDNLQLRNSFAPRNFIRIRVQLARPFIYLIKLISVDYNSQNAYFEINLESSLYDI